MAAFVEDLLINEKPLFTDDLQLCFQWISSKSSFVDLFRSEFLQSSETEDYLVSVE